MRLAALAVLLGADGLAQELPPADAQAGECYAKVLQPAPMVEKVQRVMLKAEAEELRLSEARYETVEERILVREASVEYDVIQPVYEWVEERVMIAPERTVARVVPATFRTVSEEVMMAPARVEWRPGRGAFERIDEATGEILCRVEVPAVYKTVTRQVVDQPARVVEDTIPAEYKVIRKRIVKEPGRMEEKRIPAEYETVRVQKLVSPLRVDRVAIAPEFGEVREDVREGIESVVWKPILCETNTTPDMIRSIQAALNRNGVEAGKPDGIMGRGTLRAIEEFQRREGLATGGLTLETVSALGVEM